MSDPANMADAWASNTSADDYEENEAVVDDAQYEEARTLPDWSEYRRSAIFKNLENTFGFELIVEVPKMYQWVGSDWAPLVVSRMYEEVMIVLDSAEFYASERISAVVSNDRAGVRYIDDEFQFDVYFDELGDLHLERGGSSTERFYNWYRRIMPSLTSLVNRILSAVTDVLGAGGSHTKPSNKHRIELKPVAVSYRFRFLAYDFTKPPSDTVERNDVILRQLLKVVPGSTGGLQDAGSLEGAGQIGRVDIGLSRFVEDLPGAWAREIYQVQGPSNRHYTTLWFDFAYRGESFETPDGERRRFDPDKFLRAYEVPLVDFLRIRVIENFLTQLTAGTVFQTSTGSLP